MVTAKAQQTIPSNTNYYNRLHPRRSYCHIVSNQSCTTTDYTHVVVTAASFQISRESLNTNNHVGIQRFVKRRADSVTRTCCRPLCQVPANIPCSYNYHNNNNSNNINNLNNDSHNKHQQQQTVQTDNNNVTASLNTKLTTTT